jgi:hypothetical protein
MTGSVVPIAASRTWTPDVAPAVEAVAGRLREQTEELAGALIDELRKQDAGVVAEAEAESGLRETSLEAVESFLRLLASGRPVRARERAALEALAAERCAHGVALDELLAVVRAGLFHGWHVISEELVAEASGSRCSLGEVGTWFFRLLEDTTEAVACGYVERRADAISCRAVALGEIARELIAGSSEPPAALVQRAMLLGHDLTAPHVVVLVAPVAGDADESSLRTARTELVESADALDAGLRSGETDHAALLAAAPDGDGRDRLLRRCSQIAERHSVTVLVSGLVAGHERLHQVYDEACAALRLAAARPDPGGLVEMDDLLLHRTVDALPAQLREELVGRALSGLLDLPDTQRTTLVTTLGALYRTGWNASRAAQSLFVDPKTLRARIAKLTRVTGLCPRTSGGRFRLELTLHALELPGELLKPPQKGALTPPAAA